MLCFAEGDGSNVCDALGAGLSRGGLYTTIEKHER